MNSSSNPTSGFAILIPTWNNLDYLKLCIESIRTHSAFDHQVVVHVNEGTDGTLQWVREQGLDHTYSAQNVGVCLAVNQMRSLVQRDYILYLNDDMYLLPGWDEALMREVRSLPDKMFYLSGTMIQPHNKLDVGILADYGDTPQTFDRDRLLREYMQHPMADWCGATWPPSLVHRDVWDMVGGYSIEYTPGMYSDPDFTAKLYMVGVRHFKGLADCRVYHFETKSTSRVRRNNGSQQFLLKWGITNRTLREHLTHLGEAWPPAVAAATAGGRPTSAPTSSAYLRARLKAIWQLLRGRQFGPVHPLGEE